jgi:DNA-binding NtrC family response regulator
MGNLLAKKQGTILVVDDSNLVLMTVESLLVAAGFHVLAATSGNDAQRVAAEYKGDIDLLLSDVEMPGMTGPELGKLLKEDRSNLRVMLMSGLPGGDLLVLNYGWAFIQKPFVAQKLVQMVNRVIESPDKSQGSYGYDTSEA